MFTTLPTAVAARSRISRVLGFCVLLPLMGCTTPKPQPVAVQPQAMLAPSMTGTIAAIRAESSAQDSTGSIQQIMTILGQPAQPATNASEIVLRLADNTFRTNVQAPSTAFSVGGRAMVTPPPNVMIQPY